MENNEKIDEVFVSIFKSPKSFTSKVIDRELATLPQLLTDTGAENLKFKRINMNFLGSKHYGVHVSYKLNGLSSYQKRIFLISGEYVYIVTAACRQKDITDNLLAMFKKYKGN